MTKGIFFDLDNTLIDTFAACRTSFYQSVEKDLGKEKALMAVEDMIKYQNDKVELKYVKDKVQVGLNYYKQKYQLSFSCSDKEYVENFREVATKIVKAYPETFEVLDYLSGKYQLELITNGFSNRQRTKLKVSGVEKYFPTAIISDEVNLAKPDREIFYLACEKHHLEPKECVYVGDKTEFDIKGAYEVGMQAILIGKEDIVCPYEHLYIKNLKELKELY